MHGMQLAGIDLNLLLVLHALLEEQHVGRAAKRIGLSPSATSHALGRLRDALADPLFVRAGAKLVPTARALAVREDLARAVAALEQVVKRPTAARPESLTRSFRIETTDHVQLVLLRRLDALARVEAPGIDIYLQPLQPETSVRLRRGDADLAIGVYNTVAPDVRVEPVLPDRLVAVVRKRHPALKRKLSLTAFAALPHLLVAPNGSPTGLVDRLLAEKGLKRRVARTSPSFLDVAMLVSETDYVVSLPESLVTPLLERFELALLPLPLTLPSFTLSIAFHQSLERDPEQVWFRGLVKRAMAPEAR